MNDYAVYDSSNASRISGTIGSSIVTAPISFLEGKELLDQWIRITYTVIFFNFKISQTLTISYVSRLIALVYL